MPQHEHPSDTPAPTPAAIDSLATSVAEHAEASVERISTWLAQLTDGDEPHDPFLQGLRGFLRTHLHPSSTEPTHLTRLASGGFAALAQELIARVQAAFGGAPPSAEETLATATGPVAPTTPASSTTDSARPATRVQRPTPDITTPATATQTPQQTRIPPATTQTGTQNQQQRQEQRREERQETAQQSMLTVFPEGRNLVGGSSYTFSLDGTEHTVQFQSNGILLDGTRHTITALGAGPFGADVTLGITNVTRRGTTLSLTAGFLIKSGTMQSSEAALTRIVRTLLAGNSEETTTTVDGKTQRIRIQ